MAGDSTQAWVTSALCDDDVLRAISLCYSIKYVFSTRKVAVIAADKLLSSNKKALADAFDHFVVLDDGWNHAGLKTEDFAKLFTLTLKCFETCLYLSPTMLAIKNCDEIFDQYDPIDRFVWSENEGTSIFLLRPSLKTFKILIQQLCGWNIKLETFLRNWTTANGDSTFITGKYNFRLSFENSRQIGFNPDTSIINLIDLPFGIAVEQLGLFHRVIIAKIKLLCEETVQPLLKTNKSVDFDDASKPEAMQLAPPYTKEPIAVVGMSCRYPSANNIEEFWNVLINGEDATGNPPEFRWRPEHSVKHGPQFRWTNAGFLKSPVDEFDAKFFGISPMEASFMDPQQRLLYEVVWEGLEDAAINPQSLNGSNGGVFVGTFANDFKDILTAGGNNEWYRSYMGNSIGNSAARISFLLGMTGPSIATESGCSSSMVAVHLGCRSLLHNECKIALACGINLLLEPFDETRMPMALSADGHCKTFDANADGFARAEGIGVLVLKRLSDAIEDGDRIWGLVRGTGVSQEGLSKSMGTPTVHCEALAMKLALADAGIDPSLVTYVEAHGTGTKVGDPIEIEAMRRAYESNARKEPLVIGSVKTNIGHTEACAGIAGMMKVLLAMKHEVIPPHINFGTLNPDIDLDAIPARLPLAPLKWERIKGVPRFAGVSSFGISGTDSHAVIEEPPMVLSSNEAISKIAFERPLHIMKICAKTEEALEMLLESYKERLINTTNDFQDLAYTANIGRADFSHKVIIVAASKMEASNIIEEKKFMKWNKSELGLGKICFLFTGQGSQYPGMAKELYHMSPIFRMHFEYCESILKNSYGINITQILWSTEDPIEIGRTIYSQTSIFCVEYSLLKLLESWGIKADFVVGHSLGEFAAAVCAGVLDIEDALKLVAERSILIDQLPRGKMLVIKAEQTRVNKIMAEFAGKDQSKLLDYAAVNSNHQTVVSGYTDVIMEFFKKCKESDLKCVVLEATHAFHSKHMDPMLEKYQRVASTIKKRSDDSDDGHCKFISGMLGSVVQASQIDSEYWTQQTRERVNFLDASTVAVELGCRTFIEVGPQPVLTALTMMNNEGKKLLCLPTLKKNVSNWETLLNTVGKLYIKGIEINWKGLDAFYSRKKVSIPHYAFIRKKYWPEISTATAGATTLHPLLGSVISNASSIKLFQSGLNLDVLEYLKDHTVGNNIIFPGAGYLEMCLAAGLASVENSPSSGVLARPTRAMKVENLIINAPFALQESTISQVQTVVEFNNSQGNQRDWNEMSIKIFCKINSTELNDESWRIHASATFFPLPKSDERQVFFDKNLFLSNLKMPSQENTSTQMYTQMASAGLNFGPKFKIIEKIWKYAEDKSRKETILVKVKSPYDHNMDNGKTQYIIHPSIFDAMIQAIGLLNPIPKWKKIFSVPVKIGKFLWLSDTNYSLDDSIYILAYKEDTIISNASALLLNSSGLVLGVMSSVELLETTVKAIDSVLDQQSATVQQDIWEEVWKKKSSTVEHSTNMERAKGEFHGQELLPILEEKYNNVSSDIYDILQNLDQLAYLNYLRALYDLGWNPKSNDDILPIFNETNLFHQLGIKSNFRKYFSFICKVFEEEGIFKRVYKDDLNEVVWSIGISPPSHKETLELLTSRLLNNDLVKNFPPTSLFQKIGENLSSYFKGTESALALLFPNKNKGTISIADFFQHLWHDFKLSEHNQEILQVVLNHIRDSQENGHQFKIRILEIGAGTGVYSQTLLKLLDDTGLQFDYTYTDISSAFFLDTEKKFGKYLSSMTFKKLNIEKDPIAQGFIPNHFDLVVADDVIHATRNIAESLQNVRILMKPFGRLLIFETTSASRLITFAAGVLDGYWRFEDFELRKDHCILNKATLEEVLKSNGFQVNSSFSMLNNNSAMIVALKTTQSISCNNISRKIWLLFHLPKHPISESVRTKISNVAGRRVIAITSGERLEGSIHSGDIVLRKEVYEDFSTVLNNFKAQQLEIEGIVYCWALDEKITAQEQVLQPYFNLTKSMLRLDLSPFPRLTLITSGVIPLEKNEEHLYHPSTLWGYTKSMKNENFHINCKCIDVADGRMDESRMEEVYNEIWSMDKYIQVAFSENSRFVPKFMPCTIPNDELKLPNGTDRFQLVLSDTRSIRDLQFGPFNDFNIGDDEVEVLVKASALNFRDILSVLKPSEQFKNFNAVGIDFAGVVKRIGRNVTLWKISDHVCGYNLENVGLPSHVKIGQDEIIPVPEHWTFSQAATIPTVYITSIVCLIENAKIKKDDVVLLHTASGGVGLSAIEICKQVGCNVIATAGSKRKQNYLRSLGIQHIFNSRSIEYEYQIMELTNGRGVDVVLNSLTSEGFKEATLRVCAKNARFIEISKLNIWHPTEVKEFRPDVEYKIVDVSNYDRKHRMRSRYMSTLRKYLDEKSIKAIPFTRFDALNIRQALEYLRHAKHIGKIVCTMPELKIEENVLKVYTPMFSNNSTYLITGGLGGIGMEVCQWMIEKGAKYVVLASRNPPVSSISKKISEMNSKNGVNVIPVQLDVSKYGDCEQFFETKIQDLKLPPVGGVMHTAGILADGLIVNMDWKKMCSTFDSKISGTINLHELTKDLNLEFFVIFSSLASILGNPSQSNHAAANAFEDAFAHYRNSMGLPVTTIDWGQWGETGVAKENFVPGIKTISSKQGIDRLECVRKAHRVQTSIVNIDSFAMFSKFIPMLAIYLDDRVWKASKTTSSLTTRSEEFWQMYNSTSDPNMKISILKKQMQTIIRNTLRIGDEDIIDDETDLHESGMDSLLFVEIRNCIQVLVGDQLVVSASSIKTCDTVSHFASTMVKLIAEENLKNESKPDQQDGSMCSSINSFLLVHTIHNPSGGETSAPLFIAHGLHGVRSQWDRIAKRIAEKTYRRVITFDARCHGDSPFQADLAYELMADDILRLAQQLDIGKFSMLGHSMGGKTVMTFALKYPELLDKLVVVDITPFKEAVESPPWKEFFKTFANILSNSDTNALPLSEVKKNADGSLKGIYFEAEEKKYILANLVDKDGTILWAGKPSLEILIKNINDVMSFPTALLDLKFDKPTLFIKGENSASHIPYSIFPKVQAIFLNAKLIGVQNTGHFPNTENPEGFMDSLLPFLQNKNG